MSRRAQRHRRSSTFLLGLLAGVMAGGAGANPRGPQVVHGDALFATPDPATLHITNTPGAIIHWQSFNIGAGETTRFIQQSAQSAVLNRVVGGNPSEILGHLLSNGRVFLINRNGILFGRGAVVDTAGLVASTLDMSDASFLAGRLAFIPDADAGPVRNEGYVKTAPGGDIFLIAPSVENSGLIETERGEIVLAAGHRIELVSLDSDYMSYEVRAPEGEALNLGRMLAHGGAARVFAGNIRNAGTIAADSIGVDANGVVELRASASLELAAGGTVSATGEGGAAGGRVMLVADAGAGDATTAVDLAGDVQVSGTAGGAVQIEADHVTHSGDVRADGMTTGGSVAIKARAAYTATETALISANADAGSGGRIAIEAGDSLASTALHSASGTTGGEILLLGREVALQGALVEARGTQGGGRIRVGGGYQGGEELPAAERTFVDMLTQLRADATARGDGGSVVVWSDGATRYDGQASARGGEQGGDGGLVEISGGELVFNGGVDVSAPRGAAGTLLLDPKSITLVPGGTLLTTAFRDPAPSAGSGFGSSFHCFAGGLLSGCGGGADRILFYDPLDDVAGADAGAVYLFDLGSGGLLSTLTGAQAGDRVGSGQISFFPTLPAGQVLLRHPQFNGNGGAFTPFNLTTGLNGVVSTANSIVGNPGDLIVGSSFNTSVPGRLIMTNSNWGGGRGAATVLNSTTFRFAASGGFGTVGPANSLVGAAAGDFVGSGGVQFLSSGVVYVRSPSFNANAGALTPITATTTPTGLVSASNSILGASGGDMLGSFGIDTFSVTGVGLVRTPNFNAAAGAITPIDLLTGRFKVGGGLGAIGPANSLVGSAGGDQVGSGGVLGLGGRAWVYSPNWNGGAGALTHYSSTSFPVGPVGAGNSIIGDPGDGLGSGGITTFALSGKTVVLSPGFGAGSGAITILDDATGQFAVGGGTGPVSSANSLVGGATGDAVGDGGLINTFSGGVFVHSASWNSNAGALTFFSNSVMPVGILGAANSIIGNPGDRIGNVEINPFLLSGLTMVFSDQFDPGGAPGAGAVTVLDNATGQFAVGGGFGAVSGTNSLTGTAGDGLGSGGSGDFWFLGSGGALLSTPGFNGNAGALTYFDSGTLPVGILGPAQSIVGDAPGANLGGGGIEPFALPGQVIVLSPDALGTFGAVTVLDDTTGQFAVGGGFGALSGANSLTGSATGDFVGDGGVYTDFGGTAFVHSTSWNAGRGALTFFDGATPVGPVGAGNSIIGASAGDGLGNSEIDPFTLFGHTMVYTGDFNGGAGAVTVLDNATGQFAVGGGFGAIGAANSLVGAAPGDGVGSNGSGDLVFLSSGHLLLHTPGFDSGAGALTFFDGFGAAPPIGQVAAGNSIIGDAPGAMLGSGGFDTFSLSSKVMVFSPQALGTLGAVTVLDDGTGQFAVGGGFGAIAASNSLTGSSAGDLVGSGGFSFTGSGLVYSPSWNGNAGAFTFFSDTVTPVGPVDATNSVFGNPGDQIGSAGIITFTVPGQVGIMSPLFGGGVGAVTMLDASTGQFKAGGGFGLVGMGNSLVGTTPGDLGGAYLGIIDATRFAVFSPNWDNGAASNAGAITYGTLAGGVTGTIGLTVSLIGTNTNDFVGAFSSFVGFGTSGNRYYRISNWNNSAGALTLFTAGAAPPVGPVSAANSLIGSSPGDFVGNASVQTLFGNRVFISVPNWDNGAAVNAGAVVMGTGAGVVGTISASNALIGTNANDQVGAFGLTAVGSGNYVIRSPSWNAGRGAVTFVSPTRIPTGAITATNSFVGSTPNDGIGNSVFTLFNTTRFAISAPNWDNGAAVDAGAFTIADSATGIFGTPSSSVSLIGAGAGDLIGSGGLVTDFGTGNFLLRSPQWNMGAGAVTFVNPNAGVTGVVNGGNSLTGASAGDMIGSGGVFSLGNDRFGVISPLADAVLADGSAIDGAGRFDIINGAALTGGAVLNPANFGFGVNPSGNTTLGAQDVARFLAGGGSLVLQAHGDIIVSPGADLVAKAGSLTLQAGRSILIEASIDPVVLNLLANDPAADPLLRGAGPGDLVVRATTQPVIVEAQRLVVSAQNVLVQGGSADGAFAALGGLEEVKLTASTLTFNAGTGANADAILFAPSGLLELAVGTCTNCTELSVDPLLDPLTQSGIFKGFPNFNVAINELLALSDAEGAFGEELGEEEEEEEREAARECR